LAHQRDFHELTYGRSPTGTGWGLHGDFIGLRQRLDYLQWLGVDCIWLLPIYPSPLRDDGYDIASYYGIHPTFGHLEDFMMTVDEIHRRGMRIIADLVINHTSDQHPWFQEARRAKDTPTRNFYGSPRQTDTQAHGHLPGYGVSMGADEGSGEYYWHRFYNSQPDLDFDNPAVHDAVST
jgi:maltose alpha-D-glucosyltransferase/alpha-amylase